MQFERTAIPDVIIWRPKRIEDARGFFSEVWREDVFTAEAGPVRFVQENHSKSAPRGTLRGLHFQKDPHPQGKLVRVVAGAIVDVAVDIRQGSPTYGRHVAVRLDAQGGAQLWLPAGFAHGFQTLEPDTEVVYRVTDYYSHPDDRGLAYDDPALGIEWPLPNEVLVSDKDGRHPSLADLPPYFTLDAASSGAGV